MEQDLMFAGSETGDFEGTVGAGDRRRISPRSTNSSHRDTNSLDANVAADDATANRRSSLQLNRQSLAAAPDLPFQQRRKLIPFGLDRKIVGALRKMNEEVA